MPPAATLEPEASPPARPRIGWGWLAFVVALTGWHGAFLAEPARVEWFGLAVYPQFIDSLAVLSAAEAAQRGIEVYAPNPLDPYSRPHSYPSLWLQLGRLGLTRADNAWFSALAIGLALLAGVCTARPRTLREAVEAFAVLGGPGMIFAVYRANNDLWIFALLALLVPAITHPQRLARFVAPAIVAFAAALKYYPAAAAVVLLAEPRRRERRLLLGVFGILMLVVVASVLGDLRHFAVTQPTIDRFWSFGAALAFREAGFGGARLAGLACGMAVAVAAIVCARGGVPPRAWEEREFLTFVLGGVLLAGCFWAGPNWGYRWIFAVWLLPWLWRLRRGGDALARTWPWRVVRSGWWIPMWFAPLYLWLLQLGGLQLATHAPAWWFSQAIEWTWFIALTWILAPCAWHRLRSPAV